jgi:sodium-dependent phosphate transporter
LPWLFAIPPFRKFRADFAVGSTAGVGIVSSGWRALNYRGFAWIALGWILTVPIAGTLAGCLLGLFVNAPHF